MSTEMSNFSDDQGLFLKDNLTSQYFDLKSPKGYRFNSEDGTFTNQFQVIFQDPTLSTEEFTNNTVIVRVNQFLSIIILNLKHSTHKNTYKLSRLSRK